MKNIVVFITMVIVLNCHAQKSAAREWNEVLLEAIRNDYARPTVHARNLFHSSIIAYDAWALFDCAAETVFLGKTFGGYTTGFRGITLPSDVHGARQEIMGYAMYRLLRHRFKDSPGAIASMEHFDNLFESYGFDSDFTSIDYSSGSYAALGNYLAQEMIAYGLQDGSNEQDDYNNRYYLPSNQPLVLQEYPEIIEIDPNRWQPLSFDLFVDQVGNTVPVSIPPFLSPEWGSVSSFALSTEYRKILNNGFDSQVYFDPGPPPYIQESGNDGMEDPYKWHFALVAAWSSHLDPNDSTLIDISPRSLGNVDINDYPKTLAEYQEFYDFRNGGDIGRGHSINPATNNPYESQWVKRSDYARVLAEFWADGPDSETPPGHWFTILNYVNDHPELVKKFNGQGRELDDLEWDVKAYLILAGAMHDAAISTWGIKGYYDYIRPISAIRYMASKGQSTDLNLPNYHPHGLPLFEDFIEVIELGDPLAGINNENIGKIKIYAWKGPDFIENPESDTAGVDWILGTQWWPYQRGTFVTPPFAGYVSGHSTFSRAAAEVLTALTGDPFFPGGIGTFDIEKNEFLVFEEGPSSSFSLQWATYRDASDQTSLSRIWGGIHPPVDDIPGRLIGERIGKSAFAYATEFFAGKGSDDCSNKDTSLLYPIPIQSDIHLNTEYRGTIAFRVYGIDGRMVFSTEMTISDSDTSIELPALAKGLYLVKVLRSDSRELLSQKVLK